MKRPIKETITGPMPVRLGSGAYGPMTVVVAVLGLALAIILYQRTVREQQEGTRLAFEHGARVCAAEVDREDDRGESLVQALGGFVEATERMERDRFRTFCAAAVRRDNRAQALEWVPRVPHDRRGEYEEAARNEGLAGFRFTERGASGGTVPADLRDEYFPAYFVEPLAGNEADVGFDLGSDPARLAALVKAAETGGLVATTRLTLEQGTGARFGYLMARAVYETGASLGSAEDRHRNLRGFVLGVFRIDAIVESALSERPPAGLDLYLFDDAAPAAERFLVYHASRTRSDPTEAGPEDLSKPAPFEYRAPISAADRTWTLVIRPAPSFLAAHRSGEAYAVAAAVAVLTGTTVGLLFLLGRAARHNVLLVARQAESLHFQDALKVSEARYRVLFESSRDAIMTLEPPSWQFTSGNPATVSMFNAASEQDFIAHEPWTLSPERQPDGRASADAAKERIETAMRDGSHLFEWTHRRTKGESFPATVLLSRLETDGKAFLQATVRDITEARRAHAQIESLHRRNEMILNSAGEGIYGVDLEGNVTFVNLAALKLLGYTREELTGKLLHALIHHTRPDGRLYPGEECPIYAASTDGLVHHVADEVFWRKDGTGFPVEYLSNPMRDEQGALIGAVVTFSDVTEQKRAEEDKQTIAERLRKEQRLAAVGTLACGMGHEVNNPIMGIMNYAQLIMDRIQGKDEALEEFAGGIVIEAERIAGIVRSLSSFASRRAAARVSIPVSDLVESALAPLRDAFTHDRIALEVDLPDNLPAVVCDRGQIAQVLTSLLSNARDALNEKYPERDDDRVIFLSAELGVRNAAEGWEGGAPSDAEPGTIRTASGPQVDGPDSCSVPSSELRIATSDLPHPALRLRLTVEDHGAGIPLDVREHIFEPFFTTKDRSVGAGSIGKGLGLFVSHAYMQEHGGVLSVESEVGQWTRFCIDLPVDAEAREEGRQAGEEVHEGG